MGTVTTLPYRQDGWTVDDLESLPEDDGLRYELVDGALLVTPPPRPWHDDLAAQLLVVLAPALPHDHRIALAVGVYFDERNYRQPDLAVYRREAATAERIWASDCLLAVELVSPSSVANDTIAKPALYASAGIPFYWRLHREPLQLVAAALDGLAYREVGRFHNEVMLTEPVELQFRLRDLLP